MAVAGETARVRLGRSSSCVRCDAGKGCGAGVFGRLLKRNPVTLDLDNTVNALPGQPVMVGIPETVFLRMVARLYLLPLLAGLAGAAVGHYLSVVGQLSPGGSDALTLLAGLVSGATVMAWKNRGDREFPASLIVHLLRVISNKETRK